MENHEHKGKIPAASGVPVFDRQFFDGEEAFTTIGDGMLGGKASGLFFVQRLIAEDYPDGKFKNITVSIPRLTVLSTDIFDTFIESNNLRDVIGPDSSDTFIATKFQQADLPFDVVGDLRALINKVHQPLAIRSSSLLEDAMFEPFAGVYATKMIPNNQHDPDTRFRKLVEAIKLIYASVFFSDARDYIQSTKHDASEEKMAVIIQEVVGSRHGDRFYPTVSGVARSYNFYPMGRARPQDGVVDLAIGLGKTIVDGGNCWTYSPAYPNIDPPFTIDDLLQQTQKELWAVNMGKPPEFDPIKETEYMIQADLHAAEEDATLNWVASTWQAQNDRMVMGTSVDGPRVLNFAPILKINDIPLNDLLQKLLRMCEEAIGSEVEIEFALTIGDNGRTLRFGFLQVRPMVVSQKKIEVTEDELTGDNLLLASDRALGNGILSDVRDVVYVKPDGFSASKTPAVAAELAKINRTLISEERPYVLIGFGRWGSSDPWLGTPVNWGQIAGAKVLVEATLPEMNVELSQGAHFFHNITSFGIFHFSVRHDSRFDIDWDWLANQPAEQETDTVRHVRLDSPLTVKVDGRHCRGIIER